MKQAVALEKTAPRSGSVSTLTAAASNLAAASIAKNTWIAYQGALDRLQDFLRKQGRDLTGLDDSQLAEYLTRLHGSGASPASAAMVCAAVRFLAKTMGQPSPAGPLSGRVMAGLRREGNDRGPGPGTGFAVGPGRYRRRCQQWGAVSRGLAGCGPDCRHVGLPATGV